MNCLMSKNWYNGWGLDSGKGTTNVFYSFRYLIPEYTEKVGDERINDEGTMKTLNYGILPCPGDLFRLAYNTNSGKKYVLKINYAHELYSEFEVTSENLDCICDFLDDFAGHISNTRSRRSFEPIIFEYSEE